MSMSPMRRPRKPVETKVAKSAAPQTMSPLSGEDSDDAGIANGSQKLQKMLAAAGLGSRREMEAWIADGRVTVNGKIATLGTRIVADDRVLLDKRPVRLTFEVELPRILIYHKPEGEIVSRDDPKSRKTVFDELPRVRNGKWIAIGRLDFNTEGLLIFTTHGELANRLMHPSFEVEREYAVRIMGELSQEQMRQMTSGIELDDGTAFLERIVEQGGEGSNRWYKVIIKEGRNREIRRIFEAMGMMVSRLIRVRFGILNLPPRIKRGQMLELETGQVAAILKWADLPVPAALPQNRPQDKRR